MPSLMVASSSPQVPLNSSSISPSQIPLNIVDTLEAHTINNNLPFSTYKMSVLLGMVGGTLIILLILSLLTARKWKLQIQVLNSIRANDLPYQIEMDKQDTHLSNQIERMYEQETKSQTHEEVHETDVAQIMEAKPQISKETVATKREAIINTYMQSGNKENNIQDLLCGQMKCIGDSTYIDDDHKGTLATSSYNLTYKDGDYMDTLTTTAYTFFEYLLS